jgi:hypothetical protein
MSRCQELSWQVSVLLAVVCCSYKLKTARAVWFSLQSYKNVIKEGVCSEWVIVVQSQLNNFAAMSWREQVNFQWDDDEVCFVQDQHALLDFYIASSLKQQSADTHIAPHGHITHYKSLLFLLNAVRFVEKQQIPI